MAHVGITALDEDCVVMKAHADTSLWLKNIGAGSPFLSLDGR